jgi:hypothetical protein
MATIDNYEFLKNIPINTRIDQERNAMGLSGKYLNTFALYAMGGILLVLFALFLSFYLIIVAILYFVFFYRKIKKRETLYGKSGFEKEQYSKNQPTKVKYSHY